MKSSLRPGVFWVMAAAVGFNIDAAEPTTNAPENPRQQLREQLRPLTPEERQAKIREIRESLGTGGTWRAEAERRREEWKTLPPEQRRAKLMEWREQRPEAAPAINAENRQIYRQQIRERLQKQLAELRAKKTQGGLTPEEQKRLEHLEQVARYFNAPSPPTNP